MPENPVDDKLRCAHCGDVIGVYEPMIVVVEGEPLKVSSGADRDRDRQLGECYHHDCYAPGGSVVPPPRRRISSTGKAKTQT